MQPSKASSRALRYLLHDRGLSETTIRAYACGYAPPSNRADLTLRYLAITSYPPEHAVLAGVARSPKENVYIDIFRDRVITPIRDVHGSTIALAGRVLPGAPPKAPKYINGPETAIFKKTKTLFGADIAKEAPSAKADHGYIFVVEGYMDVLTIFEKTQGRIACVATMGTSVTVAQLNAAYDLLADPADAKIVINFDSDDAGFKAVERLCDSVIPRSVCPHCIYIAFPPNPMKDSDEFLRVVGKAEEYVQYLLDTAQPWYEWCGSRIVQPEVQRLSELEETEFEEDPRIKQLNDAAMKYLDPKEKTFDFILAEYLRRQRDDILIAYGAPQDILGKGDKKGWPACSEDVIEKLASLVATASLILPGLNKSALIHSWADSLSGGRPTVLTPLFARIVKRCDDICKPWEETSVASQVYWMPPPPWVVEELPKDKQKTLGSEKGYVPPGEESDLDLMLADPKRFKRSMDKMRHQEKHILPGIRERQGDKTKMLKAAPRRAAEEIIIRTLIFASELDRLDAMALLLKVLDRCATRKLPFWTSRAREAVFDYLGSLEGSVSPDEMVAYLEDMEWWCAEVEELFTPIDTEADVEWKEVRQFEEKEPVEIVRSASMSVETMQGKVQSRLALQESGELMKSLMVTKGDMKTGKLANDPQTMEEMKKIVARQVSLRKEIDRSSFLNPEELEERDSQFEEIDAEIDLLERKKWLLENVKTQSIPFPDSGMEKQE